MAVFRASKQSQLLQLRGMATIKEKVGAHSVRSNRLHVIPTVSTNHVMASDNMVLAGFYRRLFVAFDFACAGEVIEKAGKAFTDTGKVGKKFNPDHPDGTAGTPV